MKGGFAMPVKIADGLPAQSVLENEHIFVMTEHRALHQDIRPLKIGILNLMPTKNCYRNADSALAFKLAASDRNYSGADKFICGKKHIA